MGGTTKIIKIIKTFIKTCFYLKYFPYHTVVEEIEGNLQNGEDDHADRHRDHQGVGVGEGVRLLNLDTNGS